MTKWRMYFFDKNGVKILECCEYSKESADAIVKVLIELKDKNVKSEIRSIESVIDHE